MDKSGIFVGGAIGIISVIAVFGILFTIPSEVPKPEIAIGNENSLNKVGDSITSTATLETIYSENLSLIEIFEKSEPGVVRVNVQRSERTTTTFFYVNICGHIFTYLLRRGKIL